MYVIGWFFAPKSLSLEERGTGLFVAYARTRVILSRVYSEPLNVNGIA